MSGNDENEVLMFIVPSFVGRYTSNHFMSTLNYSIVVS